MMKEEFQKQRPKPPTINLRCHDVYGGAPGGRKEFPPDNDRSILSFLHAQHGVLHLYPLFFLVLPLLQFLLIHPAQP